MNVALLIGVSNYSNCANLPGCKNDIAIMVELLKLTKKFQKIHLIADDHKAVQVKEKISTFFDEIKSEEIDEIFFYYTGHGEFLNDNFFYLMSDYDGSKRHTTSFQNSFIDDLIRTVSPKLTIKLIDACHAGTSYIKSADTVKAYFESTKGKFNNCYFLYSSQSYQSSWQGEYSDFTKAFVMSIKDCETPEARYLYIIDYITDYFQKNPEETPFFVAQATFLEKFSHIDGSIKNFIKAQLEKNIEPAKDAVSYIEQIKEESKKFITKEIASELIAQIKTVFQLTEFKDSEINQLYSPEVDIIKDLNEYEVDIAPIGAWIDKNPGVYFANPTYEYKLVTSVIEGKKRQKVISGYENKNDLDFDGIWIDFNPIVPNIPAYCLIQAFLFSKRDIRVFVCFAKYRETGWNEKKIDNNTEWQTKSLAINPITDVIQFLEKRLTDACEKIKEELRATYESDDLPF